MKHLIIYSHFNEKSFTKAIVDRLEYLSKDKYEETKIIDLYGDSFSPVLNMYDIEYASTGKNIPADVKAYQDMITWANHITIVFPLWWGQMPAMMKGFIDRVFTNGFSFSFENDSYRPLLIGKTAQVYINTGSPSEIYQQIGMHKSISQIMNEGVFGFCGIDTKTVFFGNVNLSSPQVRHDYLNSIH